MITNNGYYQQPPSGKRKIRKMAIVELAVTIIVIVTGAVLISNQKATERKEEDNRRSINKVLSPYKTSYLPNIFVDNIDLGGMSAQDGIDAVINNINARENTWSLNLTYKGHVFFTLHYSDMFQKADISEVYKMMENLYGLGKTGNLSDMKKDYDELQSNPRYVYTNTDEINVGLLDNILGQIKAQIDSPPTNARLVAFNPDNNDPFVIADDIPGYELETDSIKQEILKMVLSSQSGDYEIVPKVLYADVLTSDVRKMVMLRGKAITPISSSSTEDRNNNIMVAFSRLNGQIIQPGETLSFNKVTLDRTLKNGYRYAIEYNYGLEDVGIGGGVCQASTTLYIASLLSDIGIVKRVSHSDPVSYTVFGQDATVVYGKHDMVIKNTTNSPIYICAQIRQGKNKKRECEVRIYGSSLEEGTEYKLATNTVETLNAPLDVEYIKDKAHTYVMYVDEEPYLVRKARDGYVNETYRQKWQNGVLIDEEFISRDICKPRSAVYAVGTQKRR